MITFNFKFAANNKSAMKHRSITLQLCIKADVETITQAARIQSPMRAPKNSDDD